MGYAWGYDTLWKCHTVRAGCVLSRALVTHVPHMLWQNTLHSEHESLIHDQGITKDDLMQCMSFGSNLYLHVPQTQQSFPPRTEGSRDKTNLSLQRERAWGRG